MKHSEIKAMLGRPALPVDVVLDTDTYNEIDDQFALAYLINSGEALRLRAIYAAPFLNHKSNSPADGMEKSYTEIHTILRLMGREDLLPLVHRGSESFLENAHLPLVSPAARHLVALAAGYSSQNPLYVVAIGAITNIASALLIDPSIAEKMVVVWLGGHSHDWSCDKHTPRGASYGREFNLSQDVHAAKILFGCGVPLVQLPCMGVVSALRTGGPELNHWLAGKNPLCDYLLHTTTSQALADGGLRTWTRAIWDVAPVAWLLEESFTFDRILPSPIPEADHYRFDNTRHPIRYVYHVDRDAIFQDLFTKLAR